jgi:hypothetical protein
MEKQKRSLVENNTVNFGNYTKTEFLKVFYKYTGDEIKELASKELESVNYFVSIEKEDSNYWKKKQKRLKQIINEKIINKKFAS